MENEYGVTIDIKKSSTLSVPGTFNPLVIIKKLNFYHPIIESKDKEKNSPNKFSKRLSPKKNNFINNFNINKNFSSSSNLNSEFQIKPKNRIENSESNGPIIHNRRESTTENNNLLKSLRYNKFKKEKNEMVGTSKDFNYTKRTLISNYLYSPTKSEKDKFDSNSIIFDKIENKIKINSGNFISNQSTIIIKREKSEKVMLRGKSSCSDLNEINKDKDSLNTSAVHLHTISEKGHKKKRKKDKVRDKEKEKEKEINPVILPKIINSNTNSNMNNRCNFSISKGEEEKNLANKETLRKNYSQNLALFRKTSESIFNSHKRSDNTNSAGSSSYNILGNNSSTNRYTSVMKTYRDKKLHLFDKNKSFYYVIIPGNSSYLVKNCMQHRINWKECSSNVTTLFNFKWQQNNIGIDFATLSKVSTIKQIVNHFEFHSQISNKCNLFINLMKYCESKNIEVFKFMPFTVLIQYDSPNFINQMDNFNQFYNTIKEYLLDSATTEKLKKDPYLSLSSKECKYKKYNTIFSIPGTGNEKVGTKSNIFIDSNLFDNKNFWIVKACDLNRGRCIKLADSLPRIQKLVKKFYEGIYKDFSNDNDDIENDPFKHKNNISDEEKKKIMNKKYRSNFVIIQKYIEKPLLYRGRKFDIRIWVLITHKLKVYIFREGHLKTSSVNYDINVRDSYVHITNYSIQKYNDNFSKFEFGNEVSFKDFQIFLDETYPNENFNIQNDFVKRMKDIIEISAKAVKSKINTNERNFSFEIFGYDFIMDSEFNIYLLEINTNPGLEESSPLIKILVPRMIDDALRLTIDDICDTKYSFSQYIDDNTGNNLNLIEENNQNASKEDIKSNIYVSPFQVENYSDSDNIWESVCDLNEKEKVDKIEKNEKEKKKKRSKSKAKN